jgi:hypothetical protein
MKKEFPEVVKHLLEVIQKNSGGLDLSKISDLVDEETRVTFMPEEYYNDFFEEIVDVRGVALAREFIKRDGTLAEAFPWALSSKGHSFWQRVEDETRENYRYENGITPTSKPSKQSESINDLIMEAESRGFTEGASTKYGVIRNRRTPSSPILDHELQNDGTFYYRNIKVRDSKGKWIKANVDAKPQYDESEEMVAIHEKLEALIRALTK